MLNLTNLSSHNIHYRSNLVLTTMLNIPYYKLSLFKIKQYNRKKVIMYKKTIPFLHSIV